MKPSRVMEDTGEIEFAVKRCEINAREDMLVSGSSYEGGYRPYEVWFGNGFLFKRFSKHFLPRDGKCIFFSFRSLSGFCLKVF